MREEQFATMERLPSIMVFVVLLKRRSDEGSVDSTCHDRFLMTPVLVLTDDLPHTVSKSQSVIAIYLKGDVVEYGIPSSIPSTDISTSS